MKRILSLIAATILFALPSFAQTRALATLSHEGQLKFFDNVSAFEDAVNAAKNGDIIYLSEGNFGASKSSLTIDKRISIVGCGYNSHILPDITLKNNATNLSMILEAPLFDGVRLEKLNFSSTSSVYIKNIEIKKCKIAKIELSTGIKNLKLDRCYITDFSGAKTNNVQLYNCKISILRGANCEIVENCNIYNIYLYSPSYILNSIIDICQSPKNDANNLGIFENCLIANTSNLPSYYERRNCYKPAEGITSVIGAKLECTIEDMSPYVGTDGTVIGVYGGQWLPYSETPSVPTVDSSKSSVEYDKNTNKLNVTITVAPN